MLIKLTNAILKAADTESNSKVKASINRLVKLLKSDNYEK